MTSFTSLLSELCGQQPPFADTVDFPVGGMGLSQLNEALLSLGFDVVSEPFFAFLARGSSGCVSDCVVDDLRQFGECVERFQRHALMRSGNVKFAFKDMRLASEDDIENEIEWGSPYDKSRYTQRHRPLRVIEEISAEDTPLLGYIVDKEIRKLRGKSGFEKYVQELEEKTEAARKIGRRNHHAYLASDHMDVYVATSMRAPHEYLAVNRMANQIFSSSTLSELNPRYFDPTQAYCSHRIDKGLAEALMLKRAKCTIYLAQETDTLGKDSELASTLAQGKPVIAYVPRLDEKSALVELEFAISAPRFDAKNPSRVSRILEHIARVDPSVAWSDEIVRTWIHDPDAADPVEVERFAVQKMIEKFDSRAQMLQDVHPLGIQVQLDAGVANGVLVARTLQDCSELVRRVMMRDLEFELDRAEVDGEAYLFLRESLTNSVFRVATGDQFLTNAFWNHYL